MSTKCFCHLGEYEVKDATARKSIEEHNLEFEALKNLFDEQNKKFAEYDKKFDEQNKEITSLNKTLEGISTKIANVEKQLITVDTRLAQLEEKTETKYYTVSYYDTLGNILEQTVYEENTNITIPTASKVGYTVPTGHTFQKWTDQSGKTYQPGASVVVESDMTFTAVLSANTVWVDYKSYNGGMVSGDPYSYGDVITVCTPDRVGKIGNVLTIPDGYEFKGWTCSDGKTYYGGETITLTDNIVFTGVVLGYVLGIQVAPNTTFDSVFSTIGVPQDLYVLDAVDGYYILDGEVCYAYKPDTHLSNTYSLEKFYYIADEDNNIVNGTDVMNPTIKYVSYRSTYTVKYVSEGETIHTFNVLDGDTHNILTNTSVEIPDGYLWSHWSCSNGASYEGTYMEQITVTKNLTFTAVYVEIPTEHTITYISEGETIHTETVEDGGTHNILTYANVEIPDGKVWSNWKCSNGASYEGTYMEQITVTTDLIFTAVYVDIPTYTVKYVSEGTTIHTETVESGGKHNILTYADVEIPDGKVWSNWKCSNGASYEGVWLEQITVTTDLTFTAVYTTIPTTYTATYITNGQTVKVYEYDAGSVVGVSDITNVSGITPTGHTFSHWVDQDGKTYYSGDYPSVTMDKNYTFTAVYERNTYNIYYYASGYTAGNQTAQYGDTILVYGEPDSVDYPRPSDTPYFAGWRGSDGRLYQPGDSVTIYANFSFSAEFKKPNINM